MSSPKQERAARSVMKPVVCFKEPILEEEEEPDVSLGLPPSPPSDQELEHDPPTPPPLDSPIANVTPIESPKTSPSATPSAVAPPPTSLRTSTLVAQTRQRRPVRVQLLLRPPYRRALRSRPMPPSDDVADRVLRVFNGHGASLSSIWRDSSDSTVLRVRTSAAEGLTALKSTIANALPLARVQLGTSALDGETEAEIYVPTAENEFKLAMKMTRAFWGYRVVRWLGRTLLVTAISIYILELNQGSLAWQS